MHGKNRRSAKGGRADRRQEVRRTAGRTSLAWRIAILVLIVLTVGCGYVLSGKWEDDPKNWGRAFHSVKPDNVVVVHSEYWRSPHWTYEAGYAFEIQANQKLHDQLFKENQLSRVPTEHLRDAHSLCFACPAWFAPEPIDRYEIWAYSNEPNSHFRVLVDQRTGNIFVTDYQI
jgi:hypothetical protein